MALTSRQIISRAYRANNITPLGQDPTDAELTEGLGSYQMFVASLFGNDIGRLLQPWEVPPAPTSRYPERFPNYPENPATSFINEQQVWRNPPANSNIITNAGIGGPVYFPPQPSNGAQMALINVGADFVTFPQVLDGNGRLIEGAATLTLSTAPTGPIVWFYRDDLANWVRVTDLAIDSDSILPSKFDDFMVCGMAVYVSGSNGVTPPPDVQLRAKRGHTLLKTTYHQAAPGATFPGAWRFGTYQAYGTPWRFGGAGSF